MIPIVIHEFDLNVDLAIPYHLKREIFRKMNIFHFGVEAVPLDKEWPEGKYGPISENIHHRLSMTHNKKVRVRVMSDGNLEIVEKT